MVQKPCIKPSFLSSVMESLDDHTDSDLAAVSLLATAINDQLHLDRVSPNDDTSTTKHSNKPQILICDAGYGLPRETRPRKEKILAIVRQLVNFIEWQRRQEETNNNITMAEIRVVACADEGVRQELEERILTLLDGTELPAYMSFSCQSLEDACQDMVDDEVVYLSPDAEESLDPSQMPPRVVVVGLLIDRRIQPNRSNDRALKLNIVSKRWPLEECFKEISANEPLNVDCIMEGMQQWWWNYKDQAKNAIGNHSDGKEAFIQAALQAINHHAERHPSRPVHLKS